MKTKLLLQITVAFLIPIIISFLTDLLPLSILGDWKCNGSETIINGNTDEIIQNGCNVGNIHSATLHYGYRHWLLILLGIVLFVANMFQIFNKKEN